MSFRSTPGRTPDAGPRGWGPAFAREDAACGEGAVFKRILVPIDLSDRNTRTLDVALELARGNGALVTLCHVIQSVRDVPSVELRKFYRRLEATSAGTLARVAKRFTAREVPVNTVVCIGEPAREIVRIAAGRRIDLIVMG